MLISSITARGLTLTTSCMNVPLSSENGPNDIACWQPITSVKKAVAALTSGTVMPVWSWPRRPGMESAEAGRLEALSASAATASRYFDFVMIASPSLQQTWSCGRSLLLRHDSRPLLIEPAGLDIGQRDRRQQLFCVGMLRGAKDLRHWPVLHDL